MKQIRRGIFETNSSSVHAITVTSKKPVIDGEYVQIHFVTGEFGWEHVIYCDYNSKASYLWTTIIHHFIKDYVHPSGQYDEKSYIVIDKENPEYIRRREAIRTALYKYGLDEENPFSIEFEEDFNNDWTKNRDGGYIDHLPELDFVDDIIFNEDRLYRFLFNDSSRIETWNDNEWYYEGEDDVYKNWEDRCWRYFTVPKDTEYKFLKNN